MDYKIFDAMENGQYGRQEKASHQEYMERVLRRACMASSGEKVRINDTLSPSFVACDAEKESLTLAFAVEEWMCNPLGMLHGGILSTCIDLSMGLLMRFLRATTQAAMVQLSVNFLRPVHRGTGFTVCAKASKAGQRPAFLSAEVTTAQEQKPAATATSVFI